MAEQVAVEPRRKTLDDMRVSSAEVSTDLPFFAERSQRPNTRKPSDRHHVFYTFFPKDPNCEVYKLTKATRARCRNRPEPRGDGIHLPRRELVML